MLAKFIFIAHNISTPFIEFSLVDSLVDEIDAQSSAVAHDLNVLVHVHQFVHRHSAQTLKREEKKRKEMRGSEDMKLGR